MFFDTRPVVTPVFPQAVDALLKSCQALKWSFATAYFMRDGTPGKMSFELQQSTLVRTVAALRAALDTKKSADLFVKRADVVSATARAKELFKSLVDGAAAAAADGVLDVNNGRAPVPSRAAGVADDGAQLASVLEASREASAKEEDDRLRVVLQASMLK